LRDKSKQANTHFHALKTETTEMWRAARQHEFSLVSLHGEYVTIKDEGKAMAFN